MAPTSFASAAAGNNANPNARAESAGDWSRRANGATQTFRRPSHATTPSGSISQPAARDASGTPIPSANTGVYVPPHAQRNGGSVEGRYQYSRDQLLQLQQAEQGSGAIRDGLSKLFVNSWEPNLPNGSSSASWGRKDDHSRDAQSGVDLCWDRDGSVVPLSLSEMTEDEREVFASSVNSPLKPPTQNTNKDGIQKEGLSLRKTSISGAGAYGLSSPISARPGNRRRDTSEAFPFPANSLASPSASRFAREESSPVALPPSLARRRTDYKDQNPGAAEERDKEKGAAENANPFGSLKRTTTAPYAGNASPSTWSATQGGGFSPMGTFGSFTHPQPEKKPGMGSGRGESRFKGLMGKGSLEDLDKGSKEKSSLASLGSVSEAEPSHSQTWAETRFSRPTSNDTDPYPDDDRTAGSAALRGAMDVSPQRQQGLASYGTPQRLGTRDDTGISAFGMTSDPGLFHNAHQTPQHRNGLHEPMSPTNTNPYQSPNHGAPHHNGGDNVAPDYQNSQFSGMGSFHADHSAGTGLPSHPFGGLGSLGRASGAFVEHAASDRSQTSSVGPARGFPTIPGLGGGIPGLGGSNAWPTGSQPLGTPVRERGFGGGLESMFGAFGESQSPSLSGLGSSSLFGAGHGGTLGRTSRLGSLFPTAMQEQMRSEQHRPPGDEASQGDRLQSMTGRAAFGSQVPSHGVPVRDSDSPFRNTRNLFEDFTGGHMDDAAGQPANLTTSLSMAALNQTRTAQPSAQTPVSNNTASNQPPQPQQRRMVMPDRMRWIYRDPTGNVQGPFSGLEMHDWYKGGFFSPELQVKKQEDGDYEPLLQLIRRIGNSREPFLVPQIGISYGEDSPVAGNAWPGAATAGPASGAQPPFANAFPSFGTTLTAEQQNALERRKQEEQYLMARQKEHLNQQQQIAKQTQMGHSMLSHPLQHHSSAHSLHSQPSYGSITSPGGYQPSPTQGPLPGGPAVPGLLDNAFRATHVPGLGPVGPGMDMLGNIREEDVPAMMDHLNLGRPGQQTFGTAPPNFGQQQPDSNIQSHQVVTMLNDRARLQREQAEHDARQHLGQSDHLAQASNERLQQFRELRLQTDLHQVNANTSPPEGVIGKPTASAAEVMKQEPESRSPVGHEPATYAEPMSLTEQVQKASAKQAPPAQSAWNKVETAIHPFPPPLSQSPLPAPAAQRKPIAADSLAAEVQSRSQTPSADTPSASIAPWAKEPAEALRGPSLREIQEAEAKKAAEREALAAAARREAFEQELLAQSQAPAAQPGLPSSSTWASGASPITPVAANASVWGAKPLAGKAQGQSTANAKKTLQQIQKEEEARKLRAASQAAATANAFPATPQPLVSGKRYADLASKNAAAQPIGGGAWTTVGSSGKSKIPGAIPAPPTPVRSTSSTVIPAAIKKPVVTRSTTLGGQGATQVNAQEEFKKWVLGELRGDLQKKGINPDEFVESLLNFPMEQDLIIESVHTATHNIDSRHFAEEFIRRRKMADKGQFEEPRNTSNPAESKTGGGWSEVAKKSGQAAAQQQPNALDNANSNFRVVQQKGPKGRKIAR